MHARLGIELGWYDIFSDTMKPTKIIKQLTQLGDINDKHCLGKSPITKWSSIQFEIFVLVGY